MKPHRTRIKICGITSRDDALAAALAGADALGFNFHPPSPRYITPDAAAAIAREVPPFVTTVGLFVDADAAFVRVAAGQIGLAMLQFHGDETPAFCAQFARPFLKAVRVRPEIDLLQYAAGFSGASALLLDAYRPGIPGGTGEAFDWSLVPKDLPCRVVLAGGLTAANVGVGMRRVRPWAVDVTSGVEASPGVKDATRIAQFIAAVRAADDSLYEPK